METGFAREVPFLIRGKCFLCFILHANLQRKAVQKRWKNMKDSYLRNRKLRNGGEKRLKPYVYHRQMDYFKDFLERRENSEQASIENSTSVEHELPQDQDNVTDSVKSSLCSSKPNMSISEDRPFEQLPAKPTKTGYSSSTDNTILRKTLESSKPKTVYDSTENGDQDHEVRFSDLNTSLTEHQPIICDETTQCLFSSAETINVLHLVPEIVYDSAGNSEDDCEITLSNLGPVTKKRQLEVDKDHLVPAKQIKTGHFSSTEYIRISPKPSTVHEAVANAEDECEEGEQTLCCDQVKPAKQIKTGHLCFTEHIKANKLSPKFSEENSEENCEITPSDLGPVTKKRQLNVDNDHLVLAKQIKTAHFSSTENIKLRKIWPTTETDHDVAENAEDECEEVEQTLCSNQLKPAKQTKTGYFSSTDNMPPKPKTVHNVTLNTEWEEMDQTICSNKLKPTKQTNTDKFFFTDNINSLKLLQSSENKTKTEVSNELFLRSLLDDMSKLRPGKLRHFKTFVLAELTNLMDEQDAETVTRTRTNDLSNVYVLDSFSVES